MRVSAGMHDLRNLYARANACVACHQNVDVDTLKAGHPMLVFELDSQSINEPKHWRDDDPAIGPRSWLVGQAVALREIAWALGQAPANGRTELLEQENALAWLLDKTSFGGDLSKLSAFPGIQLSADGIAKRAVKWSPTNDELMSILRTFASAESEFVPSQSSAELSFSRAQRLTLALERLSVALGFGEKIDKELNALGQDVQRHYDFDSAAFAQHLRELRAKLQ